MLKEGKHKEHKMEPPRFSSSSSLSGTCFVYPLPPSISRLFLIYSTLLFLSILFTLHILSPLRNILPYPLSVILYMLSSDFQVVNWRYSQPVEKWISVVYHWYHWERYDWCDLLPKINRDQLSEKKWDDEGIVHDWSESWTMWMPPPSPHPKKIFTRLMVSLV